MNKQKTTGYILVGIALILFAYVLYKNNDRRQVPIVFSPTRMVAGLWENYKIGYLEPETLRTLDKQQNNITTSEGQSYTMLRSVWTDDKETFDTSWKWTKDNLGRPNDHLTSWLFGERPDGSYGILTQRGGFNSASDAETDIALALLFAHARWSDTTYLGDAINIIRDIWEHEVVVIRGKPYMAADNVSKTMGSKILVNPSYLAPYAYRIFAEVDPAHDWKGVVDTSYEVVEESLRSNLGSRQSAHLPPDWVTIDKTTGVMEAVAGSTTLTTNFGYDALRLPWRLALDWQWNGEPRAKEALSKMAFLSNEWKEHGRINSVYAHDGSVVANYETPAMYGGVIGYFKVVEPKMAEDVYKKKLQSLFNPDDLQWKSVLGYYDENWAWFGMALYHDLLPNLYKQ